MVVNLTEKARAVFEVRLSITKAYDAARNQAEREHRKERTRFMASEFTQEFARVKGKHYGTIHRWWRTYIKEGEEGLIPRYGQNKGKTIIRKRLAHLIKGLIVPSKTTAQILAEFLKACEAAGEKAPSKPTIRTYIKSRREAEGRPYAPPKVKSRAELLEDVSQLRKENETLRSEVIRLKGKNV